MPIQTKLTISTSDFQRGLKTAQSTANSAMNSVSKSAQTASKGVQSIGNAAAQMSGRAGTAISSVTSALSKMGPVGIAIGGVFAGVALAIAGVVKAANAVSSKVDGIAKSAKSVDMSADGYIALQHACAAAGVSMDKMLVVIQKVDDAIMKASEGTKKARDAFYSIGLSWRDLQRMSPEQRLVAIVDAMRQLKAEGKTIPSEFRDMVGRRGMAELNKADKEDFGKLAAEANALGYSISPEAVALAEQYQTTLGNAGQKLLATLANMKLMQEAQKGLNDLVESWANSLDDVAGTTSKEMRELGYIGIGDVGNKLLSEINSKGEPSLSWINQADLRKAVEEHLTRDNPNMTGEDLKQAVDIQMKQFLSQSNVKDMPKWFREAFFKQVSNMYTSYGFDVNDKTTWVKKISNDTTLTPEEQVWSRANDSVDDYVRAMQAAAQASEDNVTKLRDMLNVEEQIILAEKRLQKELKDENAHLSEAMKLKMRIAMLDAQRAKAEEASANFDKYRRDAYATTQASIFSSGGYSSSTKFLIEQLQAVQPTGGFKIEDMLRRGAEQYNESVPEEKDRINMDIFQDPTNIEKVMKGMTPAQFAAVAKNVEERLTTGSFTPDDSGLRKLVHNAPNVLNDLGIPDDLASSLGIDKLGGQFMALRMKKDPKEFNDALAKLIEGADEKLDEYISNFEEAEKEAGHELPAHANYEKILQLKNMLSGMKSQQSGLQMLGDAAQFAKDMKALIDMQQTLAAVKSMDSSNFEGFMKIRNSYGKRIGSSWRTQETDDYEFLRAAGVDVSSAEKLADARLKYAEQLDKNRKVIELEAQERWASWGQNQLRNIGWQAMEKMGLGREARRQQMQQEAYSQKGTVLTRQEAAIVDRLAYLQDKISRGSDMPNFSEQVHTNELASKGGFVGGVAVDNSDTPRKQLVIMQTMSRQMSNIVSEVSHLYNALNNY